MNDKFKWLVMLLSLLFLMGCTQEEPTTPLADASTIDSYESLECGGMGLGVVKVMTWNIYVGTNVDDVLEAEDFLDLTQRVKVAYDTFQMTNFPERARAIARQIKKYRPHLIGLQEVSLVQHFDVDGQTLLEECNFLQILLDVMAARGLRYRLADSVQNIDITLPRLISYTPPSDFVLDYIRLVDADVILVDRDVQFSNPIKGEYQAKLPVPSPAGGDIIISRGYVSVEARVKNKSYRFINTHLEAFTEQVRYPQAQELATIFSGETLPSILVGDMNTGDPTPPNPYNDATYQFLTGTEAGYVDSWVHNLFRNQGSGYTSPFSAALRDPYPNLYQRIDLILVKTSGGCTGHHPIGPVWAEVIGDELKDRTITRMWPSDHAGVVAQLHLRRNFALANGEMMQE